MKKALGTLIYYGLVVAAFLVGLFAWLMSGLSLMFLRSFGKNIVDHLSPDEVRFFSKACALLIGITTVPMGLVLVGWIIAFHVQSWRLKELIEPETKKWPW